MRYAGVFETRVIIIEEAPTAPVYPPVPNCGEVQTVPIPADTLVSVGMHYTPEEGFTGEYIPPRPPQPPEPPQPQVEYIGREDFDLLDITYKSVTYHITEEDGTITMRQGEE